MSPCGIVASVGDPRASCGSLRVATVFAGAGDRASAGVNDESADSEIDASADEHLSDAFHRSVVAGEERLHRSWPNLAATGFVGGMDVGLGVLALMIVRSATGSELLGALAFTSGFVTLTLAHSELFTENFLVPVTVVVTGREHKLALVRLWLGTLLANWLGGMLFVGLVILSLPSLHDVSIEIGSFYPELGIGMESFASAMLGGVLITLMTWVERANRDVVAKLVIAVVTAFLLAAPPLNHSVVGALEMFAGLFTGDTAYGWLDTAGVLSWAVLGNVVGGVGLVTLLRLVQVGSDAIDEERRSTEHA